ncbi:hypothetical protein M3Y94_00041400 [Aphelenchoides besseyi]|nr:hypothetical protein M3Y94_00041400 [Aphelenchoides besseyi]
MAHALEDPDYAARVEFARGELDRLNADPSRLNNLVFTDEAHFHLDGAVNRQDWILWADSNPHWFDVRRFHTQKVTVWLRVGVGPFFWTPINNKRGITARWMERTLEEQVIPELRNWPNFNDLVFQQDGAPPHIGNNVLAVLDRHFSNRWIARGTHAHPAPTAWPPRSPDLTWMDYSIWGYAKSLIFNRPQPPRTLDELRQSIEEVAELIRQNRPLRQRIAANYARRLQKCIDVNGG